MIGWYKFIKDNYDAGRYNIEELNIFVAKGKITEQQKKDIINNN